jgi:hypothetical protein
MKKVKIKKYNKIWGKSKLHITYGEVKEDAPNEPEKNPSRCSSALVGFFVGQAATAASDRGPEVRSVCA